MNQSIVGTTPPEVMSPDHPLFGLDVEGLTTSDRAWLQTQFLQFYSENTRRSMEAKFARFTRFCEERNLQPMPAHRSTIYRYVRFLREEGQIAASSLPQYLAAISMVHQSNGLLGFSAFDGVTRRLTQAWNKTSTTEELRVTAVSATTIYNVLQLALTTQDIGTLRACTSALLDYIFFNRAVSGHRLLPGDLTVTDTTITFRE